MKVKVIYADYIDKEWDSPFEGELAGFCRGGDDRPYAVVIHPNGSFFMVPIHCVKRIENENDSRKDS